jgi:hypothetical protein
MKIAIQILAAVMLSLSLAAGQTASSAFGPGATADQIVHRASGFMFPIRIGLFRRVNTNQYDAAGEDVSVGYDAGVLIAATVYVYPAAGRAMEAEFASRRAEVMGVHKGASFVSERAVTVTPQHRKARAAFFTFSDVFKGSPQELESELVVAQSGARFVEYRFTYPAASADRASTEVAQFMESLAWP